MIIDGGGGYIFDCDHASFYPMQDPIYASLQDFMSSFVPYYNSQYSGFGGEYPNGCYDGIGYSSLHANLKSL